MFYYENTEDVPDADGIALILQNGHFTTMMGYCYSNSEQIFQLLDEAGYTKKHDVQTYAGWVLSSPGGWHHHEWLVIDGKSVFDSTHDKGGPFVEFTRNAAQGNISLTKINKQWLAMDIRRYNQGNAPYFERFYYGYTENWPYIGTPSNKEEATESFRRLIQEFPNHPDYRNVDPRTWHNEMNEYYYSDDFDIMDIEDDDPLYLLTHAAEVMEQAESNR